MKGWLTLEPLSEFEHKNPELGIQRLNHYAIIFSNHVYHQHVYLVAHSFVFSKNLFYSELLELVLPYT